MRFAGGVAEGSPQSLDGSIDVVVELHHRREPRATKESLFTGILFDAAGTRYTPTHANKNGSRYRYYTSQAVIKKDEKGSTPARIPAHDLETAAVGRILDWLQIPTELLAALRDETTQAAPEGFFVRILAQAAKTAQSWHERIAAGRTQFLKTVIERVVIHPSHLEICLRVPVVVNEILGSDPSAVGLPPIALLDRAFRDRRLRPQRFCMLRLTSIFSGGQSTGAIAIAIHKGVHRYESPKTQQTSVLF